MIPKKKVIVFLPSFIIGIVVVFKLKPLLEEEAYVQDSTKMAFISHRETNAERNSRPISLPTRHGESRYGEVVRGQDHIIIYNSVPKCGSRTFHDTSRQIFKNHSIEYNRYSLKDESRTINEKSRFGSKDKIRRLIMGVKRPAYVQGHGLFLPFHYRLHKPQPVYINFIRDPVSRMVSLFYYTRFGDGHREGFINENIKNMSIEECILDGHDQCTKAGLYPQIFCGFNPKCGKDTTWALEQAKSNIDKYYTFIGITEDYEASLRVLEHLIPDIYNGTTELYLSFINEETSRVQSTKTKNKKPLSQDLNDTLTELFAVDYELYNYIYDKHRNLKARFGIV